MLDPLLHGIASRRRDLELDGTLCLVLHHHRSRGHLPPELILPAVSELERAEDQSAWPGEVETDLRER